MFEGKVTGIPAPSVQWTWRGLPLEASDGCSVLKNTEIFLSVGGGGERGEGEEDLVRREERASGAADPGPRSRG